MFQNKYVYRHLRDIPLIKTQTNFKTLAKDLNIDCKKLREYHHGLHSLPKGDRHLLYETLAGVATIFLEEAGIRSYLDNYWLREGTKGIK